MAGKKIEVPETIYRTMQNDLIELQDFKQKVVETLDGMINEVDEKEKMYHQIGKKMSEQRAYSVGKALRSLKGRLNLEKQTEGGKE